MIVDPRPLEPAFVPGDVRHREGEVDALTSSLDPLLDGRHADPALLTGPSGTGKTCIARHVGDRLQRETDATVQYVNCWDAYTRYKTLYRLLEGIGEAYDVHRQSTPRDSLLDRLRENLDTPYVAILDEVDQLEEKGVLYDLHRTRGLSVVLIANAEEALYAPLEERVASRLKTAHHIRFDRYGVDELVAILEDRVRWGLREDAITNEQLRWVADAAAGDARVAIGTLRAAAEAADREGAARITDAMLREAAPEAKSKIRQQSLEKLTPHQRVVYDLITERDGVRPDALYEAYREAVDEPRAERTLRNYLRKMRRYNLVTAEGEGKARRYSTVE
ncbi:orc1/cdc6 family replication initiation protein [Salinirubellus salinus]|uniref:Orc1/cdc6 family replication initiation protein n=1 Tax=Salinirubellus salinus TaxID=1364945 RepID=A0A9E7R4G3_9EURY|nr:Cdc6/Cdc18 family protein [Salinirubellus salinus]UWM55685.1 orc1/cdc6 family replication initiation protein [Salinirubellus salinus]